MRQKGLGIRPESGSKKSFQPANLPVVPDVIRLSGRLCHPRAWLRASVGGREGQGGYKATNGPIGRVIVGKLPVGSMSRLTSSPLSLTPLFH